MSRAGGPARGAVTSGAPAAQGTIGVMDIRAARIEDVPEIAVVHVRSWQAAYGGLLPQAYLDGLDPSQRTGRWERSLSATDWSHGGTLVADADGRLSGFVSFGPARDDDAESRRAGEIYAIYLLPAAWDEGIGRQQVNRVDLPGSL